MTKEVGKRAVPPHRVGKLRMLILTIATVLGALALGGLAGGTAGAAPQPSWPNSTTPVNCIPVAGATYPPGVQPGGLDHFLCYQATNPEALPPVKLTDQFGTYDQVPLVPGGSSNLNQTLCNPVDKTLLTPSPGGPPGTSYPATNLNAHLYSYDDDTGAIKPNVDPAGYTVNNQFGKFELTINHATRLCLPTWKYDPSNPTPPPGGSVPPTAWADPSTLQLNHFQCYSVTVDSGPAAPQLQLQDQFGTYQSVQVSSAAELCAPVIKTVEDTAGGVAGPDSDINSDGVNGAHLLCFNLDTTPVPHTPTVLIGNQFSTTPVGSSGIPAPVPAQVAAVPSQLCLPSFKVPNTTTGTPEVPTVVLLPLTAVGLGAVAWIVRRRRTIPAVESQQH